METPAAKTRKMDKTSKPDNKHAKTTPRISFSNHDSQIWEREERSQREILTDEQKMRHPLTHPDDVNLQIYPTQINGGIEQLYIDPLDPQPQTTSQKRREELTIGLF